MNISLRQLRAFVAIAHWGSLTRAAQELHITPAGLSLMLRELEGQLGCRLFDRTTRSVVLTNHGQSLLPLTDRFIKELETTSSSLRKESAEAQGTLVVGTSPLLASSVGPRLYRQFSEQYPSTSIYIHDLDVFDMLDGVEAGWLDAGFGAFLEPRAGVQRKVLLRTSLILVSPASEAPNLSSTMSWRRVQNLTLIGVVDKHPIQTMIDAQMRAHGVEAEWSLKFHNVQTVLAMVEAGQGSAILPSFVVPATARYRVVLTQLARPVAYLDYYLITKKGRLSSPLVAVFSSCIREVLEQEIEAGMKDLRSSVETPWNTR